MKKIINGKLYDTSTAHLVGAWDNQLYGNPDYAGESLYRKRTGEFFLHGEGGARSRYAQLAGENRWAGGEAIIPLRWEAARQWAEEYLDADEYQAAFGQIAEDDSRTVVTLSLSASSLEKAKRSASQKGMSLSAYIESLL